MSKQTLFLFPDTNLFIQCYPLEQLDWSALPPFEEVHLIVCRPVQREIDNQKKRGNSRVSQRARRTYTVFRDIITGNEDFLLVREANPRVKLLLEGLSLPSQELENMLDYSKVDDEIIGCLHRFRKENEHKDARLLTHDGGPMMTAKSLNLPFIAIGNSWILPPESNETERENARLKSEIAQLKKSEPSFQITCFDAEDSEVQGMEVECRVYEPLSDDDLDELIELLKSWNPIVKVFIDKKEPGEPTTRKFNAIMHGTFANPPSPRAIAKYQDREYPGWIKDCRLVLSKLHKSLQLESGLPRIRFAIENSGTRPGRDTLIEFRARGPFKLVPPSEDHPDWLDEEEGISLHLPSPPEAPRSRSFLSGMANLESLDYTALARSLDSPSVSGHDHNAFYYKPEFPSAPSGLISLACDQWRHGNEPQEFFVELWADANSGKVTGQLECVVQAENLSSPATKAVLVRINVIKMNTKDYAYGLVQSQL